MDGPAGYLGEGAFLYNPPGASLVHPTGVNHLGLDGGLVHPEDAGAGDVSWVGGRVDKIEMYYIA